MIFPEGTRSRDGRLRNFKMGGLSELLAAAPTLPIVPATIDGSWELLRHKLFPVPFGTRVRVRFSEPMERHPGEEQSELIERARAVIEGTLMEWRAAHA